MLAKAQAALPVVAGTKNVIIFLSDGDFNASSSQLSNQTTKTTKQCDQAITAAQAATDGRHDGLRRRLRRARRAAASSGDTHNPCTTMQAIASNSTKFYSTNTSCQNNRVCERTIGSLPSAVPVESATSSDQAAAGGEVGARS